MRPNTRKKQKLRIKWEQTNLPNPLPVILKEIQQFNPFAPGDFGKKKTVLKLVKRFSSH